MQTFWPAAGCMQVWSPVSSPDQLGAHPTVLNTVTRAYACTTGHAAFIVAVGEVESK